MLTAKGKGIIREAFVAAVRGYKINDATVVPHSATSGSKLVFDIRPEIFQHVQKIELFTAGGELLYSRTVDIVVEAQMYLEIEVLFCEV